MNAYRFLFIALLFSTMTFFAQESGNMPIRTPEQEATRQTEKLKQELNLTPQQSKEVYEINLRYAKQRQVSNSRTEAMERIKNKDADLKRVLDNEQYDRLQNKHYERSTYKIPEENQRPVRGGQEIRNSSSTPISNEPVPENTRSSGNTSNQRGTQEQQEPVRNSTTPRTSTPNQSSGDRPVRETNNRPSSNQNTRNNNTIQPTNRPAPAQNSANPSNRRSTTTPQYTTPNRSSGNYQTPRQPQNTNRQVAPPPAQNNRQPARNSNNQQSSSRSRR